MEPVDNKHETKMSAIKVLVVDDLDQVRGALGKLLSLQDGIIVVGDADDGFGAVELANTLNPDVILMDWKMPNMDGLAAAKSIKDCHPEIGVILLSIHNIDQLKQHAHHAYIDEFIAKEIDPNSLIKTIRKVHAQTKQEN